MILWNKKKILDLTFLLYLSNKFEYFSAKWFVNISNKINNINPILHTKINNNCKYWLTIIYSILTTAFLAYDPACGKMKQRKPSKIHNHMDMNLGAIRKGSVCLTAQDTEVSKIEKIARQTRGELKMRIEVWDNVKRVNKIILICWNFYSWAPLPWIKVWFKDTSEEPRARQMVIQYFRDIKFTPCCINLKPTKSLFILWESLTQQ